MSNLSKKLDAEIRLEAKNRCGYCLGEQCYIFAPLEIDHLLPTALGGTDTEENLWLACRLCNSHKGIKHTALTDLAERECRFLILENKTGNDISESKTELKLSAKPRPDVRAVFALQMNNKIALMVRKNWLIAGWYPPKEI
jgi:hypothetical protein